MPTTIKKKPSNWPGRNSGGVMSNTLRATYDIPTEHIDTPSAPSSAQRLSPTPGIIIIRIICHSDGFLYPLCV